MMTNVRIKDSTTTIHHPQSSFGDDTSAPPEIKDLCEFADFISGAGISMKPCFKTKTFVHKDSWFGSLYRRAYGENGILGAREICDAGERLAYAIKMYENTVWHDTLCKKAESFIAGVLVISQTYQEYPNITPILNSSVTCVEKSLVRFSKIVVPSCGGDQT